MEKLDMAEREKKEDYEIRKKDALAFLQRLRAMRKKRSDWRQYETDDENPAL
jgi:hypothetical protein